MAFDWGTLTGQVIGAGTGAFGAAQTVKAAQIQADAQAKNNETALELQRLKNEEAKNILLGTQSGSSTTSNTTLYIALGVGGVLVLGLTIFAVTRK